MRSSRDQLDGTGSLTPLRSLHNCWLRWALFGLTAAFTVMPGLSAPLSPYVGTYLLVQKPDPQGGGAIRIFDASSFDPNNPISIETTVPLGATSSVWVKGSATASFGSMGAYTSAKLTDPTGLESATALSVAQFNDRLMITQPGKNAGDPGFLTFGFHLEGTGSGSASTRVDVLAGILGLGSSRLFLPVASNQTINGQYFLPQQVPFRFGEWFELDFEMGTFVTVANGRTEGMLDFSNTLLLNSLRVFDGNRQAVDGWSYSAASGTQYQFQQIPEPASIGMLGLGLLGLTGFCALQRGHRR